jgi:undecaprenyl-diphosphatase
MQIVEAVVLGLVQGLTEFLPISSTAHLRVVPALLGWPDPGAAYSAAIQLGSVCAVITYFWKDLWSLLTGALSALKRKDMSAQDVRILGGILLGTLPICILGLALKKLLEQDDGPFRSFYVIGTASIVMGLLLLAAEFVGKRKRGLENIGAVDGLLVGLGQALALIPGCSRSGSTLTIALLLNMKREDAARFSFLLGLPAITLAGLLELKELIGSGLNSQDLMPLVVGLIFSTAVSYAAIAWLIKFLQTHSTTAFICYRVLFGIAVIALSANHLIK